MADESLTFNIEARDLASRTVNKVTAEVTGLTGAFGKMSKSVALGTLAGNLMTKGAELLGQGLRDVVNFVGDSIDAASDLAESQNKVSVVFGDSTSIVERFAETSAEAAGISKQSALEAAGAFGNMFKTVGLADSESAKFSTTMVQLASDMASFNNEDPTEMLDKLRSGLAGEAEPLRRFGVLLSEATVKAFAYRTGIAEAGAELTEAQKVQARYGVILEQTSVQQGDFARTSDGLANSQRSLTAQMEDLQTEIGERLLPVALQFTHWIADDGIPLLEKFLDLLGDVGDVFGTIGDVIGTVVSPLAAFGRWLDDLIVGVDEVHSAMTEEWAEAWQSAASSVTTVNGYIVSTAKELPSTVKGVVDDTAKEFGKLPGGAADAILENQFHFNDAVNELKEFMDNALTRTQEIARLRGFLSSKALAEGLASNNALVRRKAEEMQAAATARLNELTSRGHEAGASLSLAFAQGITAGSGDALQAAARLAAGVAGFLPHSEPKNPRSALRGITTLGADMVNMIAGGILHGIPLAERATASLAGALMPGLGTGAGLAGATSGGQVSLTVNFNSTFPPKPSDADALARQMYPALERVRRRQNAKRR